MSKNEPCCRTDVSTPGTANRQGSLAQIMAAITAFTRTYFLQIQFVHKTGMIDLSRSGYIQVGTQENSERIHRFVEAFEKRYGRKPRPEDSEGNFPIQVAEDMQMSVGGARYYLRLASEQEKEKS